MSQYRNKLHDNFLAEYHQLNDRQRQAVDTIDGPVMVVAGPGTGKTQILACRIGKILLETDALPENILCLTYTDAGVVAMRKRLLRFIGPDAHRVNIHTYHAFCNEVIQDNLPLFEKTSLDAISELEKVQLFKKLIDSLPTNHLLKRNRGDVYYDAPNFDRMFAVMKKEGWTVAFIEQKINDYLEQIKSDPEFRYKVTRGNFKKGDLKPAYFEEVDKMEKTVAAIREFVRYEDMMSKMRRYDFDDMIIWVLRVFREHPNVLAGYQEKFQYILVDEYQDTSGTQNQLIQMLIDFWDSPNIFVVGDDDQSIFRFQGANVENMESLAKRYDDQMVKVVLTSNYRSTQPVLDAARSLIERNTERLTNQFPNLDKNLVSSHADIKNIHVVPVVREYLTMKDEMIDIVEKTEALIQSGVPPSEIGIIYKEHKYGTDLTRYFSLLNIPVYSKRNLNALELPLAVKLIKILKYLASEHFIPFSGEAQLFELLHFDWFGVASMEIAGVSMQVASRRYTSRPTSIRETIQGIRDASDPDSPSVNISKALRSASDIIEKLLAAVPNLTLQQLFETIIREVGVIAAIMNEPDRHWQLQILNALFDFIKEETHRNPSLGLQEIVTLIDLMESEEIPIPLVQISGTEKGVSLMTAHGSKGLEFEHVFVAGTNSCFWEKKKVSERGFKIPPTVFLSSSRGDNLQELRRLFYVAITRAKTHLYISYGRFKNDGKEMEPSMFIAEITENYQLAEEKPVISDSSTLRFAQLTFGIGASPRIAALEDDIITPMLEKFTMNVTALNSYLRCPLSFYYNNFIRIPSAKNEATEFGSAAHYALRMLFEKRKKDQPTDFPDKEKFIGFFQSYMNEHREAFSKEQFDRRMEYGREILASYYDTYIEYFRENHVVSVETRINALVEGIPIKGALDKLEFKGKNVNVVDYKTGNALNGLKKLAPPSDKLPNGDDYWRQAVFYKILVDHYPLKDWTVTSAEFDFVEPDKKSGYIRKKLVITPQDVTTVTQQIKQTWEKIQNRDFYTGCGKDDCNWCQFVKTNKLVVSWEQPEEDG